MERSISSLNPQIVWKHFAAICSIPHPSYHEEALREYVVKFAKRHNIWHTVDGAGNVIMRKPATKGTEGRKGIILQAHFDMVPQKNGDKLFDFEKDPIQAYIEGEWVTADGTTLGADNGIGLAAILAVFESGDLAHGPLEALCTMTEETGMEGAFGLKGGLLNGGILINLDSEAEGELYVGCAGGLDANITLDYMPEQVPEGFKAVRVGIRGLKGGHSGIEIVLQRGNANRLLMRFIRSQMREAGALLVSVDGGGLRNAIPREAAAVMAVPERSVAAVLAAAADYEKTIIGEYENIEDSISFGAEEMADMPREMIDAKSGTAAVNAALGCPDGVVRMSASMPGLVQTSTNLARIVSDGSAIRMQCLIRSSLTSEKHALGQQIVSVFELAGARVELTGEYDGWNPDMNSPILRTMTAGYKELYGREPKVAAIHAGLECGIIAGAYPHLDMISAGPTICFPHSPDEKVNIASVARFWEYLRHTLENAPEAVDE